jgi:hypothetical protein
VEVFLFKKETNGGTFAGFLLHYTHYIQTATERRVRFFQHLPGIDHGRQRTLHVRRPKAIQHTVRYLAAERWVLPAAKLATRHRVHVPFKHNHWTGSASHTANHVAQSISAHLRESYAVHLFDQSLGYRSLLTRGAWQPNEFLGKLHQLRFGGRSKRKTHQ